MKNTEHYVGERAALARKWISNKVENLLDAGCDDGNNAYLLSDKSGHTWGIDINPKAIKRAQENYPSLSFSCGRIENTPFNDKFFDVIVMNDVLEHIENETTAINEMERILKPGGQLIISTPHKGLFAFLDPANIKYFFGNHESEKHFHRHYSLKDFKIILNNSNFKNNYVINKIFRSGLILGVLIMDIKAILRRVMGRKLSEMIMSPFSRIASFEYWIPFGKFAYNISISVIKK